MTTILKYYTKDRVAGEAQPRKGWSVNWHVVNLYVEEFDKVDLHDGKK